MRTLSLALFCSFGIFHFAQATTLMDGSIQSIKSKDKSNIQAACEKDINNQSDLVNLLSDRSKRLETCMKKTVAGVIDKIRDRNSKLQKKLTTAIATEKNRYKKQRYISMAEAVHENENLLAAMDYKSMIYGTDKLDEKDVDSVLGALAQIKYFEQLVK